jgi:hypothetical protein
MYIYKYIYVYIHLYFHIYMYIYIYIGLSDDEWTDVEKVLNEDDDFDWSGMAKVGAEELNDLLN